jgi:outer membrane immunogenic protein
MSVSAGSSIDLHRLVKKFFFGGVTLVALAAGSARAADVLLKVPVLVPIYNWSTCYIGGNAGYGGSLDEAISFTGSFQAAFLSTNQFPRYIPVNPKGAVAGGTVGCNAQFGQWVFGAESDLQWSDFKVVDTVSPIPRAGTQFTTTASESRRWFGTVRARAGLLVTPQALLYGTAGLAYGETELSFNTQTFANPAVNCALGLPCGSATSSGTNIGWAAGAGVEWMFARNWTIKAEYLYVDLGSRSVTGTTVPSAVPPGVFTAFSEQREHTARIGVNYSFEWGAPRGY